MKRPLGASSSFRTVILALLVETSCWRSHRHGHRHGEASRLGTNNLLHLKLEEEKKEMLHRRKRKKGLCQMKPGVVFVQVDVVNSAIGHRRLTDAGLVVVNGARIPQELPNTTPTGTPLSAL